MVGVSQSERLWQGLKDLFIDEETFGGAGPDVGLDGLSGAEVLSVGKYMSARATSMSPEPNVQDVNYEGLPDPQPTFAEAAERIARGELGSSWGGLRASSRGDRPALDQQHR